MRPLALVFWLAVAAPRGGAAQSPAARLLALAREQIEDVNGDSAATLLQAALHERSGATQAERVRGLTLFGIAELMRQNPLSARNAFVQALRLDGTLQVDSLAELQSDLLVAFSAARQLVPASAPVAPPVAAPRVAPTVVSVAASETTVTARDGRWRIAVLVSSRARVALRIAREDAPTRAVWSDTSIIGDTLTAWWSVRGTNGALVAPGRYAMQITTIDSTGMASPPVQRVVTVARMQVDTLPHPPPLDPSAFAPETLRLRRGSPAVLLIGASLGVTAAVLPGALGHVQLNAGQASDQTALAVAGVAAVAGVVGFVAGERVRFLPDSALRNVELRRRDAQQREAIVRGNEQTRADAPVRVWMEP